MCIVLKDTDMVVIKSVCNGEIGERVRVDERRVFLGEGYGMDVISVFLNLMEVVY